ncbi:Transcription factor bye1 [Chytriomyces hyalinus]|nr:Transcription factor bye1 [Chytriomyces hyalinus]
MMTEHSQPLWGMPLNALEVQFVADDIENEHEVENENKNRDAAESTAPSDSEGLMSLIEESDAHMEGNTDHQQAAIESEGGPEGGLVAPAFNSDLNTSKANAKRLVRELKQPYNEKGERVYCICRGVDDGKFMIQCDTCKDWYHGACVDISERQGRAITRYDCLQCVQAKNELIRSDIAHANTQSRRSNRSGQVDPSTASPPVVIAIPPVVGRKPPAQRAISIPNQQRRTSNTATTPNIASSINSHTSKKSDPPKPATPEPDVGPTSMAWIHDKTRSLVRKSFGEVLRTILDDFSAEGITPEHADADEKSADGAVPTEWLDVTELAGTMEDALFDLTSDGVKGLHRTCGDKYKAKFRSLQFNLKDKKNSTLRTRLLTGRLPASSLVKLEQRDLANDELRARAEAIRLQSIHDAIKPKIVDIVYKKTHKGDEVVGDASGLAAVAGGAAASSNSSAVPAFRTDNAKDDEDNLMSPVVPVAAVKQSGIAGIMAAVEAAKLAARVSVGPSKVESLDDLLSKVNSSSASAENLGEKRHAEAYYDEEPAKKSRHDQDVSSTINSGMGNSSNSWDHLAASDTWAHVDDGEGWIQSPGDDVADFKPSDSSSNTPTGSPKAAPEALENNGAIVWNGLVRMPQVGKFTGRCMQIAGKPVGSSKALWESILPPTVFIEGRIDVSRTQSYISQQRSSSSKEVIAVEFVSDTNVRDSPEEGGGASEGGFQALMDYFVQKKRYAVVGQKYVHVRDMYLVPVKRGDAVPDMMTVLSKMSVVDKCNERDRLFGVLILDKAVFSSAAVAKEAAVLKPGRSGAGKRGPPPTGSAAKKVDAKPTPVPVPTAYPSSQAAISTPWSNLFPQTIQQQPPLIAALSNGMPAANGTAAPPVTTSNANALALLMELTRQQQQQQQQQQQLHQTVGYGVPSAAAAPPVLVGGGLGLAGLLSQIKAATQQQSGSGGAGNAYSYTGGSGTYQRQ